MGKRAAKKNKRNCSTLFVKEIEMIRLCIDANDVWIVTEKTLATTEEEESPPACAQYVILHSKN
jgi:hypothetical protein